MAVTKTERIAAEPPDPPAALAWRFVDRFGTEWRLYDRVRWAPTATRAEFRFVPPGHRDARSRLFVRADRVVFELRLERAASGRPAPTDLSDRALNEQLRRARCGGPVHIPRGARTSVAHEARRAAHDFAHGDGAPLAAARSHADP